MNFPKSDIRALAFCAVALLIVGGASWMHFHLSKEEPVELSQAEVDSIVSFEQQIRHDSIAQAALRNRVPELFPFDPNHADSATLARLGFRPAQIRNIMRYRQRKGVWRSPEHFSELYGLSPEEFQRLKPYIRISSADVKKSEASWRDESEHHGVPKGETPQYEHIEKFEEGTIIDLNTADTTTLKKIPGIGSYYARKIVSARERYGGFYSSSQLSEIQGLPPGISRWFEVNPSTPLRKININKASYREMYRHPYIGKEKTLVIKKHIQNYGPLHSWRELRLYKEFTDEDFRRLSYYCTFD